MCVGGEYRGWFGVVGVVLELGVEICVRCGCRVVLELGVEMRIRCGCRVGGVSGLGVGECHQRFLLKGGME